MVGAAVDTTPRGQGPRSIEENQRVYNTLASTRDEQFQYTRPSENFGAAEAAVAKSYAAQTARAAVADTSRVAAAAHTPMPSVADLAQLLSARANSPAEAGRRAVDMVRGDLGTNAVQSNDVEAIALLSKQEAENMAERTAAAWLSSLDLGGGKPENKPDETKVLKPDQKPGVRVKEGAQGKEEPAPDEAHKRDGNGNDSWLSFDSISRTFLDQLERRPEVAAAGLVVAAGLAGIAAAARGPSPEQIATAKANLARLSGIIEALKREQALKESLLARTGHDGRVTGEEREAMAALRTIEGLKDQYTAEARRDLEVVS